MKHFCAIIPVYNHFKYLSELVEYFEKLKIFVIMIDDGSNAKTAEVIDSIVQQKKEVVKCIRHAYNQGKGAAVKTGLQEAHQLGFSHAIQIDSDGQHTWQDIPRFIEYSKKYPRCIIIGLPVYDSSVHKNRFYARYLTHIWIWINTLSFEIKDSMCGFRVYPVDFLQKLLTQVKVGDRMDFDPEVLVRLKWRGHKFINIPTKVQYPLDNTSNFNLVRDNILISKMHAKLFGLMLLKSPFILRQRFIERNND